jgi:hypothetical protein
VGGPLQVRGPIQDSFKSTVYTGRDPGPVIHRTGDRLLLTSGQAKLTLSVPMVSAAVSLGWSVHLSTVDAPAWASGTSILADTLAGLSLLASLVLLGWWHRLRRQGFTFLHRSGKGTPRWPIMLDEQGNVHLITFRALCPHCHGPMRLRAVSRSSVYLVCRRNPRLHYRLFDHTQVSAGLRRSSPVDHSDRSPLGE